MGDEILPPDETIIKSEEIDVNEEQFSCNQCAYTSTNPDAIEEHLKTHQEEKYSCDICAFRTKHAVLLLRHMKKHSDTKEYRCDKCNYKCFQESALNDHILFHEDIRRGTKCISCYKQPSGYRVHLRTHRETKAHTSVEITYNLRKKKDKIDGGGLGSTESVTTELESMEQKLNFSQEYLCEVCNLKYNKRVDFYDHFKTHCSHEPFMCSFCDYMSIHRKDLIVHCSKLHPNEKKWKRNGNVFYCTYCDYEGTWSSIAVHLSNHYTVLQYACNICSYMKSTRGFMINHMKKKHKIDYILECQFCNFKTKWLKMLREHIAIQHKGYYRCCLCNFLTKRRKIFILHTRHQHNTFVTKFKRVYYKLKKCQMCKFNAQSEIDLMFHMKLKHNVHDNVFEINKNDIVMKKLRKPKSEYKVTDKKCYICNREFQHIYYMLKHMKSHDKKEMYSCNLCGYKSIYKYQIKIHVSCHKADSEIPAPCDFCGYKARNKFDLKYHINTHKKEDFFVCHICGYKRKSKSLFRNHMLTVHNTFNQNEVTSEISKIKCESDDHTLSEDIKLPEFVQNQNNLTIL